MDWTLHTTAKLSRRSSQSEITEAVEACRAGALKECRDTGHIGITRPVNLQHADEIAKGLAIIDARRHAGEKAPPFLDWHKEVWPEANQKSGKLPYFFINETQAEYDRRVNEAKEKSTWKLSPLEEAIKGINDEDTLKAEDAELRELYGEERDEEAGEAEDTARQKVSSGLNQLREKRGTQIPQPNPLEVGAARVESILAKDPDERTSTEKIIVGRWETEDRE